jgi:hypothetical protein
MASQEEYQRLLSAGGDLTYEQIRTAIRQFDWDGNFDYDRYGKEIKQCKGKGGYNFYISESKIWKDKRLIRLMIDNFQCRSCGLSHEQGTLSVDHKCSNYKLIPYESIWDDLTTLCWGAGSCHEAITNCEHQRKNSKIVTEIIPYTRSSFAGVFSNEQSQEIQIPAHRSRPSHIPQWPTSESS